MFNISVHKNIETWIKNLKLHEKNLAENTKIVEYDNGGTMISITNEATGVEKIKAAND